MLLLALLSLTDQEFAQKMFFFRGPLTHPIVDSMYKDILQMTGMDSLRVAYIGLGLPYPHVNADPDWGPSWKYRLRRLFPFPSCPMGVDTITDEITAKKNRLYYEAIQVWKGFLSSIGSCLNIKAYA